MAFLKNIEKKLKPFIYKIFGIIFHNKTVTLPLETNKIKKILLMRYDRIGDMIVTTPIFEIIKKNISEVQLHILASDDNSKIITNDKRIDKIYILSRTIFGYIKLIPKIRKEKYDVIIACVFHHTTYSGILANLISGSKCIKVNIGHIDRNDFYSFLFNVLITPTERGDITMAEYLGKYICEIFGWNYSISLLKQELFLNSYNYQNAEKYLFDNGIKEFTVINISAKKKWSNSNWIILINEISKIIQNRIFILISSPNDFVELMTIKSNTSNTYLFPITKDLFDIAALLSKCDLVITPDTSIVHFAAVYHKPVITLYSKSGSYVNEWMPIGSKFKCLVAEAGKDLNEIKVIDVLGAYKELSSI